MLVVLKTSVLKQREVPATVSSFQVSVLYTAMLRTSIAAVVVGCINFCPLDCDASVIDVDCAAVETGCMLEKYNNVVFSESSIANAVSVASILLLLLLLRKDMQFYFLVGVLRLLIIFLLAALLLLLVLVLLTTVVLKQREVPATVSSLHVSVLYTAILRNLLLLFLAASIYAL